MGAEGAKKGVKGVKAKGAKKEGAKKAEEEMEVYYETNAKHWRCDDKKHCLARAPKLLDSYNCEEDGTFCAVKLDWFEEGIGEDGEVFERDCTAPEDYKDN